MNFYEYFLAIVETGSISRAAERLYVTQPSLSKYLRRLEKDMGISLFDRSSYPLKLTEAGEIYLKYVKEQIVRDKNLRRSFESLKDLYHGEVRVALTQWRSASLISEALAAFWSKYPSIRVVLLEGPHQYLASLLEHDRVDFALTHCPTSCHNFGCLNENLMSDSAVFAVNSRSPILRQLDDAATAALNEHQFLLFANEPFAMFQGSQNIYEVVHNFLESVGIQPNVRLVTPNLHTVMNFVRLGQGVGFAPASYAAGTVRDDDLRFFRIECAPMSWDIAATYKKTRPLSIQSRLLIDSIKATYTEKIQNGF